MRSFALLSCVPVLILGLVSSAVWAQEAGPARGPGEGASASDAGGAALESEVSPAELALADTDEVYELDNTVVEATRNDTAFGEAASSISLITAERIERQQDRQVQDVLRGVPGLDVVRGGGLGQQVSVFMRGAKSEHTLVLMDGLELNDPSGPTRAFDFAHLSTENIDRIEVMRGPQSTLWGSDAMGGVINIVTNEGSGEPRFRVGAEGGSFYTAREWGSFSGGAGMFDFSANVSRVDSKGIDATADGGDRDPYASTNGSFRLGVEPTERFGVDLSFRAQDSLTELDGAGTDDPDAELDERRLYFRAAPRLTLLDGDWEQTLNMGVTDYDRESINTGFDNAFDGRFYTVDWQHKLTMLEGHTIIGGYEYEHERFDQQNISPQSAGLHSVYLQDTVRPLEPLSVTVGLRHNEHENFGGETTYRAAAAYRIERTGTKLRASYGTGFKAPSLTQLYGFGGNTSLGAETSDGVDAGFDQSLFSDALTVSATWFYNDFDDMIVYAGGFPGGQNENVETARTQGIETSLRWRVGPNVRTRLSYTYTDVDADSRGLFIRRAPHKVGAGVSYRFAQGRGQLGMNLSYVGERQDTNFSTFPASPVTLDDYTLVDITASFDVTQYARVFGRVENVLDEEYQEIFAFNAPSIGAYGGLEFTF